MGTNKYLEYSKYLILLTIAIGIISLVYSFVGQSMMSNSPIIGSIIFYFPYINFIGSIAFSFAVLFILLHLINKEKQNNLENKNLKIPKFLLIISIILNIIGYLSVIVLNMNMQGKLTSLSYLTGFGSFGTLGTLLFDISILLVIGYYLSKK